MRTIVKILTRQERTAVGQRIYRHEVLQSGKSVGIYDTRREAREVARGIRKKELGNEPNGLA
jgi:hypothetical protein